MDRRFGLKLLQTQLMHFKTRTELTKAAKSEKINEAPLYLKDMNFTYNSKSNLITKVDCHK